ncbi:phosphatidylglycerol:prolipoprotein diacylglycerol transferase [Deinobacterium chartae]|uniref:Phosphatidylglycerol--prolipoprotein diacylglyceryl transferase n=1 Tax=Deinobacterium chartae TaxID=521158 RepID=A0A841I6Y1_9DEIO|nr:prolipoprotein diacylglyceryl transferase [Deinobacterium chartae]MBB6099642.1 phosphatidylglycerol:prolipoprotein diacylglycerol transferase [Deinobacterium chartae]
MDPIFIQIGSFTIAWYGVLMTAGILGGAIIGQRLAKARGLNASLFSDMAFWLVVWGIIGARIGFIVTSPQDFVGKGFIDYINIRAGGLSIHGGLIAGLLAFAYYVWRYKLNFYRYVDIMTPAIGLGVIGGRLGNIMNGSDTVGRLTGWPVGFTWPTWATGFPGVCKTAGGGYDLVGYAPCIEAAVRGPVHFTQLYGVIIGIILLVASFYWLRSKRPGWAFWQLVLWYSLLRAGVEETFRLNPLSWPVFLSEGPDASGIGLFTLTQVVSIPLIIVAIIMLVIIRKRPEEPVVLPAPETNPTPQVKNA